MSYDDMARAVYEISGGKNVAIFDDVGIPSIMVRIPKMYSKDLIAGVTDNEVHPAFIVDDKIKEEVYVSKYLNIVKGDRAYSLAAQDPAVNINFDTALQKCRNKGNGWGLKPFSLWSAIALWCKKNGTMPHGNNNYGADVSNPWERGIQTNASNGQTNRTATGSGSVTWYHDHTMFGIADLNGNVWDWCAGMRLVHGEIQIIPYANCMRATCDMSDGSTEWKAIMPDGSLVNPGTSGTLKYDFVSSQVQLCTTITNTTGDESASTGSNATFETMTKASGISDAPQILKELGLFPADASGYEGDHFYINNGANERFPIRGGSWRIGALVGVFCTHLCDPRSSYYTSRGFRSAFYGDI